MKQLKKFRWSITVLIIHLLIVLYFSTVIPGDVQIPRQWNYQGEVGSYSGRTFGLWFLWGMSFFLITFFTFFSYIDPRYAKNKERFDTILPRLMLLMAIFMALIHVFSLLWAIDVRIIQQQNMVFILIGALFMLLGNILPKIPSNFFAGIRSPWTLSSDSNWHKTHRVGGYVFFIAGLLMIVRAIIMSEDPAVNSVLMVMVSALCLYPFVYSYLLFRKERSDKVIKEKKGGKDE